MNNKALLIAVSFTAAAVTFAFAHGGATGIVKQRMDSMMVMGKSLDAVADMFKGKTKYDPQLIATSADELRKHAIEIEAMFPDTPDSRKGRATEALPEIWERNNEFLSIAAQLAADATELKNAALMGNQQAVRKVFGNVAKTCSACHRDFRKSKN
ncbi:MAG: hypothetical protein GKR97_08520 [Rhizobiaceae bacterium]|nr:hypothetical protein [Rhizobiaceae bacterium]